MVLLSTGFDYWVSGSLAALDNVTYFATETYFWLRR
jgi:hypothetical protein